jgi:hypothetical protein
MTFFKLAGSTSVALLFAGTLLLIASPTCSYARSSPVLPKCRQLPALWLSQATGP